MSEDCCSLLRVSHRSECDHSLRALQVPTDCISAVYQKSPIPTLTDTPLNRYFTYQQRALHFSTFLYFFVLIRIIKRILKVAVHATLSYAPGYCIANSQASPESCKSFNKCLWKSKCGGFVTGDGRRREVNEVRWKMTFSPLDFRLCFFFFFSQFLRVTQGISIF